MRAKSAVVLFCYSLIVVTTCVAESSKKSKFYEAEQACGESEQLLDAPVPGVYSYHGRRSRRSAVSDSSKLWPNGVIPYIFEAAISASAQRLIRRAMDLWEKETCIRFVKRKAERDYLYFYRGGGCCSHVGRQRGKQPLSLGTGCLRYGIIVHELGHAIGFWHEQNRPDRGNYIDILYNNVEYGKSINFDLVDEGEVQTFDQDYDYKSIMHYGSKFFNKNGGETIRPKKFYRINPNTIGSRYYSYSGDILSKMDILKANIMYKCNKTEECGGTIFGQTGSFTSDGYPDSYVKKNRDCIWILTREKSTKPPSSLPSLTLTFNDFNVGSRNQITGECEDDFVEVREGKGFLSPFLGRICGHNKPEPITTFSESLYVKFHTENGKTQGLQRFSASFKIDECSKVLVGLNGVIKSPRYPNAYPPNIDCLWKIKLNSGYRIVIEFESFKLRHIESNENCLDYVDVHQSGNQKKLIGRYCGANNPGKIVIDSPEAIIKLHVSDYERFGENSGFYASYFAEDVNECETGEHNCELYCVNYSGGYACACLPGYRPFYLKDRPHGSCLDVDECANNNGGCSHGCINTEGSFFCSCPPGFSLAANKSCIDVNECHPPFSPCSQECQNTAGSYECSCKPGFILQEDGHTCKALPRCGGDLTSPVSTIRAPVIPVSYNKEVICRWNINISVNLGLVLSLKLPWHDNMGCRSFLSIKSNQQSGGESRDNKICSKSDLPDEINIQSNVVSLEYHAVKPYPRPFSLRYRSIRLGSDMCDQTLDSDDGFIQTPGYPFRYPARITCTWRIRPKRLSRTRISFLDFSLEYSEGCIYDFLEIQEHSLHYAVVKRIGKFCGYDKPSDIVISSNNDVVIRFVSDATVRKTGVKIKFTRFY